MRPRRTFHILMILSPFVVGFLALFAGAYDITPLEVLRALVGRLSFRTAWQMRRSGVSLWTSGSPGWSWPGLWA